MKVKAWNLKEDSVIKYLIPSGGGLKKATSGWITAVDSTIMPMNGWAPASYVNEQIIIIMIWFSVIACKGSWTYIKGFEICWNMWQHDKNKVFV